MHLWVNILFYSLIPGVSQASAAFVKANLISPSIPGQLWQMWVSLEKGAVVLNSPDAVLCLNYSLCSLVKVKMRQKYLEFKIAYLGSIQVNVIYLVPVFSFVHELVNAYVTNPIGNQSFCQHIPGITLIYNFHFLYRYKFISFSVHSTSSLSINIHWSDLLSLSFKSVLSVRNTDTCSPKPCNIQPGPGCGFWSHVRHSTLPHSVWRPYTCFSDILGTIQVVSPPHFS